MKGNVVRSETKWDELNRCKLASQVIKEVVEHKLIY